MLLRRGVSETCNYFLLNWLRGIIKCLLSLSSIVQALVWSKVWQLSSLERYSLLLSIKRGSSKERAEKKKKQGNYRLKKNHRDCASSQHRKDSKAFLEKVEVMMKIKSVQRGELKRKCSAVVVQFSSSSSLYSTGKSILYCLLSPDLPCFLPFSCSKAF